MDILQKRQRIEQNFCDGKITMAEFYKQMWETIPEDLRTKDGQYTVPLKGEQMTSDKT